MAALNRQSYQRGHQERAPEQMTDVLPRNGVAKRSISAFGQQPSYCRTRISDENQRDRNHDQKGCDPREIGLPQGAGIAFRLQNSQESADNQHDPCNNRAEAVSYHQPTADVFDYAAINVQRNPNENRRESEEDKKEAKQAIAGRRGVASASASSVQVWTTGLLQSIRRQHRNHFAGAHPVPHP